MRLVAQEALDGQQVTYTLTLTQKELCGATLHSFDRAVIRDCQTGSVADTLLALELIARRIEETEAKREALREGVKP